MLSSRRSFVQELDDAADAYLVELSGGRTGIIAGYPWFGEWGRDSLIALPGLCLARNEVNEALAILESLAARLVNGLVPNIPQSGDVPPNAESIDASLLFIRATALTAKRTRSRRITALQEVCLDLIERIGVGADPRVHVDAQGFLFVDHGPWALTWMDALVDGWPVTPRQGYAVDLNALWLAGLTTTLRWAKKLRPAFVEKWDETTKKLSDHFEEKFWLHDEGFLTDTHDGNHPDGQLRPNQLWLSLPGVPIEKAHKKRALAAVREKLLTRVGLRTLSPDDPSYQPFYRAGSRSGTEPTIRGPYGPGFSASTPMRSKRLKAPRRRPRDDPRARITFRAPSDRSLHRTNQRGLRWRRAPPPEAHPHRPGVWQKCCGSLRWRADEDFDAGLGVSSPH